MLYTFLQHERLAQLLLLPAVKPARIAPPSSLPVALPPSHAIAAGIPVELPNRTHATVSRPHPADCVIIDTGKETEFLVV